AWENLSALTGASRIEICSRSRRWNCGHHSPSFAMCRLPGDVITALGSADRLVRLPSQGDVPSGTPGGTPAFDRTAASHACRLSGQAWLSDMTESSSSIRSLEPYLRINGLRMETY